jgi:hypothetical protein
MTVARYAARTAAFAAVYLLAYWLGLFIMFSPLPVAAIWMLAQGRWGLRRFDVITLATVTAASSVAGGSSMPAAFGLAALVTIPALIFAVLVERWLPGWWQGHGDRFRAGHTRLLRLAGAAALSVAGYLVLQAVMMSGISVFAVIFTLARDVAALSLVTLAGRAIVRSLAPRAAGLTVVR